MELSEKIAYYLLPHYYAVGMTQVAVYVTICHDFIVSFFFSIALYAES